MLALMESSPIYLILTYFSAIAKLFLVCYHFFKLIENFIKFYYMVIFIIFDVQSREFTVTNYCSYSLDYNKLLGIVNMYLNV